MDLKLYAYSSTVLQQSDWIQASMSNFCTCSYARPHGKSGIYNTSHGNVELAAQHKHLATATSVNIRKRNANAGMHHRTTMLASTYQESLTFSNAPRWRVGPGTRQLADSSLLACQLVACVTLVHCHCFVSGVCEVHTAIVSTHRFSAVDSFLAFCATVWQCASGDGKG